VVPNALSMRSAVMVLTKQKILIEEIRRLTMKVVIPGEIAQCMTMQLQSSLVERIKEAQASDKQLQIFKKQVDSGLRNDLVIHEDGPFDIVQGCVCPKEMSDKSC